MKSLFLGAILLVASLVAMPGQGVAANLVARVSISQQTMTVLRRGRIIHVWRVSTARRGYVTPQGKWRPVRMHRMWYSHKYHMSPMPYSVFYHGGFAIHGTNAVRHLGQPASHGCVRLDTAHAAEFYSLVKEIGAANTRIIVGN